MDISRKTDYALRMLAALVNEPDGIVSVRIAADDNDVPYSFARSIQHDLVRAGLIESLRGSRGGMRLAVEPSEVTLLQVVEAVQGPVDVSSCDSVGPDGGPCPRMSECRFNPIWRGARALLKDYFGSVTLEEVVKGERCPHVSERFWSEDAFVSFAHKCPERAE
ncbi:MAG: Rrf2 family transcriptional regulator [Atopobiaceae bacterium]|jgi:Rrf2 family protein|nr:Rrf2 family transcriptional regulator [Atopobiaceae bacterium]MCI2173847.1 Rrf2 family transcriptional regulator [Atopobiaceae bacterium]MCI2208063.1 Rrf2 family transcriptional regulator [Atopobiaceae bacterium]